MKKIIITILLMMAMSLGSTINNTVNADEKWTCVNVTLSCGVKGTACGETLKQIIDVAMDADEWICR